MSRVLGSPDYNLGASEELTTENPGPAKVSLVEERVHPSNQRG